MHPSRSNGIDPASHASRPFFAAKSQSAPFFPASPVGGPAPAVQARLTMGASGDHFEQQADSVADSVVQRMESGAGGVPAVQAKCSECAREEGLQRQVPSGSSPGAAASASPAVEQGLARQHGAGHALEAPVRREMEQHIGADFSRVRIHTGGPAAELNSQVRARAFTHGHDVFFNHGEYAPHTRAGRHLLAHELTHVVQQSGGTPRLQRDDAGGGSTEFSNTTTSTTRTSNSPVISGTVKRTETAPAKGGLPRQVVSEENMKIAFDPSTCSVTIPYGYAFTQAAPGTPGPCKAGPAPAALSTSEFNAVKAHVLSVVNESLNGWFDVELSGGTCPKGCGGRPIPIRVVATENATSPDTTVTIVNRTGRSDAGTICLGSWKDTTIRHEGAHQVLGLGDEYPEHDEKFRAVAPEWFRGERVRTDYSIMGPGLHSRFAMFHERHFAAVAAFLQDIFPGCTARLIARARPIVPDYRIRIGGGYGSLSGLHGGFFNAGLELGLPIDRLRHWELTLGPEFSVLSAFGDLRNQRALLLGARLGLEGSTGGVGFGVTGGPFVSAGHGWFDSTDYQDRTSRSAGGAYGEVGGRFGVRTELSDGMRWQFNIEGAAGRTLGVPDSFGQTDQQILSDPLRSHWVRLGLTLALEL